MHALCIDFGGTEIKLGILEGSRILSSRSLPNSGAASDLTAVSSAARRMVASTASVAISAVSIALPGIVDRRRGCLIAAHGKYDYAIGMDLRGWAEVEFGVVATIENDARAALLGEVTHGCALGEESAVLITLGTGIGTAAMLSGQLFRGAHDHGGVLGGHVTVELDGPPCNCGSVGCAEAIASTWALREIVASDPAFVSSPWWRDRVASGPIGIRDLIEAQHDAPSRELLDRFLLAWAAAIVGLCHAYDPNVVIVSGGVMRAADMILPRLTSSVHERLWSSSFRPRLVTPDAPEHSVLLGLSALADQAVRTAALDEANDERNR